MPVVINGSNGISGADGSASTPAIQGSDNNTGVFFPAADTAAIATNGTERMRIDASGNVGIGTSSPGGKLEVSGQADFTTVVGAGYGVRVRSPSGSATPAIIQFTNNLVTAQWAAIQSPSADVLAFNNGGNTERMRITSNGGVSFGSSGTAYGSSGQVLVSNGDTAPTWGSAIVSGTAQAKTSGTFKDFTGIPSWVKRITVMFSGVKISANGAELIIQIGNGSFVITGYVALSASVANNKTSSTAGFIVTQGNGTANVNSGSVVITQLSPSQWSYASTLTDVPNTSGYIGGGYLNLSGAIDRVRITTSTGTPTFTAGNINILYE